MKITKNDIVKLADLARLEISEEEKDQFFGQISQVLEYVEKLSDLDTAEIDITSQVTDQTNALREDKAVVCKDVEAILENTPELQNKQIKINSILSK